MRRLTTLVTATAMLVVAAPAHALPEFSRKTGMAGSACHDTWPRLNAFVGYGIHFTAQLRR